MGDERYERAKKALCAYTKEITATPASARDALVREGIYEKTGELNANYTQAKVRKR